MGKTGYNSRINAAYHIAAVHACRGVLQARTRNSGKGKQVLRMKILIVEDDLALARELEFLCRKWGFEARSVENFRNVQKEFSDFRADLVLMDINLPFYDGFYWCGKIRELSNVPVLFLSSRDQNADKIMGMAAGGDDYVEKPFDTELLLVKIRSMLRRAYEYTENEKTYLADNLYYENGTVYGADSQGADCERELTRSENKIMSVLIASKGCVVTREQLMQALWNTDEFVTDASLTVLVSRLRNKLHEISGGREVIFTKKGMGYYLK